MSKNQFIEQINEAQDKIEQENRSLMNSPLYPRTRAKNMAMQETEISFMYIPRRFRNKSPIDLDKEVEAYSPRKQEENDIAQEVLERDSSYDDDAAATSLMKTTQDFEKEINLAKIQDLTDQLEISKILENQLTGENKTHKKDNAKLIKTNEKLKEEVGRLKRRNELLSKQAFKWLKDKNMWQAKYEKQKVKEALFRDRHESGFDCLNRETATGTASTTEGRVSKRSKQAWGHA